VKRVAERSLTGLGGGLSCDVDLLYYPFWAPAEVGEKRAARRVGPSRAVAIPVDENVLTRGFGTHMEAVVDLSALFAQQMWDEQTYQVVQQAAFADPTSFDRFRALMGQMERDVATGTGDVKAQSLKLGLLHRLLGQHAAAAEAFAEAAPSAMRDYYYARSLRELGRFDQAVAAFERAASAGWDEITAACDRAETLLAAGDVQAAEQIVNALAARAADRPVWRYVSGRICEARGDYAVAIEHCEAAVDMQPEDGRFVFRLAFLHDLQGNDRRALDLYGLCADLPVVHANALLNLAVLYEDIGSYDEALQCLHRVLAVHPNHPRARLFLKDVEASARMYIDEELERIRAEQSAVYDTPVSEFELSVRSRNCLKKMNIHTLGDLLRTTEADLLNYKNFGETSLTEIKAMLTQKGLKLGQLPPLSPPPAQTESAQTIPGIPPELINRPVAELQLSVRSRKCLQRLGINTLGELCTRSEQELLGTRNFGQTSLNEIKRRLSELGLHLRRSGA
jgi:DNA-directed RNA polymerase subunit alpha